MTMLTPNEDRPNRIYSQDEVNKLVAEAFIKGAVWLHSEQWCDGVEPCTACERIAALGSPAKDAHES